MQVKFDVPKEFFLKGIPCRVDLKPGQKIGNYVVESILGNGTFGIVYKVKLGEKYFALKLLKLWEVVYKEQKEAVGERFLREFYAAQTNGNYLVKSHIYGEIDSNPFFIMDYIHGGDLRGKIGKLTTDEIKSIGLNILHGLNELHSVGIIHRDLKPDNILIDGTRKALLTDFGISAFVNHHIKRATKPNLFGNVRETFGTFAYIPPEQLINAKKFSTTTPKTDLWALGVLMYELFSNGCYPWGRLETESDLADFIKHVNTGVMVHTAGFNNMPSDWQQLVKSCLQSKFENRIENVNSALSLLSQISEKNVEVPLSANHDLKLIVLQANRQYLDFKLQTNQKIYNIGRAPSNQIIIEDYPTCYISRFHATIECIASLNKWFLRDGQWDENNKLWQKSTNGTFINSKKIDKNGACLNGGDIITIGDTRIKVDKL